MGVREDYFDGTINRDFFDAFAGEKLGKGCTREVWTMRKIFGLDYVIKVEYGIKLFQNAREWLVWQDFKEVEDVAKWLAPCVHISPCGTILIQARTREMAPDQRPTKVPNWTTDLKPENWGMFEGRPVLHDYGTVSFSADIKMKKVKWHDDSFG